MFLTTCTLVSFRVHLCGISGNKHRQDKISTSFHFVCLHILRFVLLKILRTRIPTPPFTILFDMSLNNTVCRERPTTVGTTRQWFGSAFSCGYMFSLYIIRNSKFFLTFFWPQMLLFSVLPVEVKY